jgi:4-hydroxy-L-threonine phosphate dehydrogenase PdxA
MAAAKKPRLAITMGDPAGVGPEVIARIWRDPSVHQLADLVVLGHPEVFRRACQQFNSNVTVTESTVIAESLSDPTRMPCVMTCRDDAANVPPGEISAEGGQAAYDALVAAARLALSGQIDGIVTAPLNKAALWQAGHH